MTLVEPKRSTKGAVGEESQKDYIRQAWNFLRAHPGVRIVVFYGIVTGACINYVWEFWQLYCSEIGVPVLLFGLVSAAASLLTSFGSLLAHRLKGRLNYHSLLTLCLWAFSHGLIVMGWLRTPIGLLFMMVAYIVAGLTEPLVAGYLHHRAESQFRATAESLQSLLLSAVTAGVGLLFGQISTRYTLGSGFVLLGALALVCLFTGNLAGSRRILSERTAEAV